MNHPTVDYLQIKKGAALLHTLSHFKSVNNFHFYILRLSFSIFGVTKISNSALLVD